MSYWSDYRAAHPEYRARERERARRRRAEGRRGDRSAEYARRRARDAEQRARRNGDNGTVMSHPLIDEAHAIVSSFTRPDRRTVVYRPTYDEVLSDVIVALVEGADASAAALRSLRAERDWEYHTCPLLLIGG